MNDDIWPMLAAEPPKSAGIERTKLVTEAILSALDGDARLHIARSFAGDIHVRKEERTAHPFGAALPSTYTRENLLYLSVDIIISDRQYAGTALATRLAELKSDAEALRLQDLADKVDRRRKKVAAAAAELAAAQAELDAVVANS